MYVCGWEGGRGRVGGWEVWGGGNSNYLLLVLCLPWELLLFLQNITETPSKPQFCFLLFLLLQVFKEGNRLREGEEGGGEGETSRRLGWSVCVWGGGREGEWSHIGEFFFIFIYSPHHALHLLGFYRLL